MALDAAHLADVGADHTHVRGGERLVMMRGRVAVEDAGACQDSLEPGDVVGGGRIMLTRFGIHDLMMCGVVASGIVFDARQRDSELLREVCGEAFKREIKNNVNGV
jgi:hypothetical protein